MHQQPTLQFPQVCGRFTRSASPRTGLIELVEAPGVGDKSQSIHYAISLLKQVRHWVETECPAEAETKAAELSLIDHGIAKLSAGVAS